MKGARLCLTSKEADVQESNDIARVPGPVNGR